MKMTQHLPIWYIGQLPEAVIDAASAVELAKEVVQLRERLARLESIINQG